MDDAAKQAQDYDHNPPRCATCVYLRHGPRTKYLVVTKTSRSGKSRQVRVNAKKHPIKNPSVDHCTFGNFEVRPQAVCNEWHSRDGERIEPELIPLRLVEGPK